MVQYVYGGTLWGVDGRLVRVEADISTGLPAFEMGGRLSSEIRESRERVRSAFKNSGVHLPPRRISLSLAPADLPKSGTGFDLPIAISILCALEMFPSAAKEGCLFIGELGLGGDVRGVSGVLPIICAARAAGIRTCFVPVDNVAEARVFEDVKIVGVESLLHTLAVLQGQDAGRDPRPVPEDTEERAGDFSEIAGMESGKRAAEIAAAGGHNLLMIGPPGAGKTMLASRMPGILPPLTREEQIEVTKIYSSRGLQNGKGLIRTRPFRAPHHTITRSAMAGGGAMARAGEVTLAHRAVLFLDELPEFDPRVLETLRQPLEDRKLTVSRVGGSFEFPADFMLVAAMNPCPCGYYPDRNRCRCTETQVRRYLGRISRPLLDRIDLVVEVPPVRYRQLREQTASEPSERIRARVIGARQRQRVRLAAFGIDCNAQMDAGTVREVCRLGKKEESYLEQVFQSLGFSARAYTRVLKLARTIADLQDEETIRLAHLSEAVSFRRAVERLWGKEG